MKMILIVAATFIIAGTVSAQDPLDATEMEQVMAPVDFSDVAKSIWDVVKKGADDYRDETTSRSEFETAAEFDARLAQRRSDLAAKIQTFVESKKIANRVFAVWFSAALVRYNADSQTYSITSSTEISVPPTAEDVTTTCPANQYISLQEKNQRGYKFAYLVLKAKSEYSWHVDGKTARGAKADEPNVAFKVWFRFDMSQAFVGGAGQFTIVPLRIALINRGSNTTYWSDDILK